MAIEKIIAQSRFVWYDGTNMAEVLELLNLTSPGPSETWRVDRTEGGLPVIKKGDYEEYVLPPARYVVRQANGGFAGIMGLDEFQFRYLENVDELLAAPLQYLGTGVGTGSTNILSGQTGNINTRVSPPVPAALLSTVKLKSDILATSGVTLGTVAVTATPVVVTANVPTSTVNGVTIPAHTLVRTTVRNSGLSVVSSIQILTFASA